MEFNELKELLSKEDNKLIIRDMFLQNNKIVSLISRMIQNFEDALSNNEDFLKVSERDISEINSLLKECLDVIVSNKLSTLESSLFTSILELINNYIESCPEDCKFDSTTLKALNILNDSRHNYSDLIYLFIFLENRFKALLTQSDNEFLLSKKYYQDYNEFLTTFGASRLNKYTFDN